MTMKKKTYKYDAFISYRHTPQDAAVAKAVHRLIEEYVIPRPLRKNGKKHRYPQQQCLASTYYRADLPTALRQ